MCEQEKPPYRVAEFWSSANPGNKVRMLAEGADIVEWAKRGDFIRWVDAPAAAPEAPAIWSKLSADTVIATFKLIDVVLDNGVTLSGKSHAEIDWTAVRDWRYASTPPAAPTASTQDDLEEALACALSEHTNLSTDGIDNCVPRLVATIPAAALPFDIVPTEGIDPVLYERAAPAVTRLKKLGGRAPDDGLIVPRELLERLLANPTCPSEIDGDPLCIGCRSVGPEDHADDCPVVALRALLGA